MWLMAAGRLRDRATEAEARSELDTIANRLKFAWPATNADRAFHAERAGQVNPGFRKMLVAFFFLLLGVAQT